MFEKKELIEERTKLVADIHTLAKSVNTRDGIWKSEEQEHFDKLDKRQEELRVKIENAERSERAFGLTLSPPTKGEVRTQHTTWADKRNAVAAFLLRGRRQQKQGLIDSANRVGLDLRNDFLEINLRSGLSTALTPDAGETIPTLTIMPEFDEALLAFSGTRQVADVQRLEQGEKRRYFSVDNTGNSASIVGENVALTTADPTFNHKDVSIYSWKTACFPVSIELTQDTRFDLLGYLSRALGEQIARGQEPKFISGNGTGTFNGVIASGTSALTSASATAITYGEYNDLQAALDPGYSNPVWFMHQASVAKIKGMVDDSNRPLWNISLSAISGVDSFLGSPIQVCNSMDKMTASKKAVAYGSFKHYKILDVGGLQVRVLNERYIDQGAIGVVAFMRTGANLLNAKAVQYITQHA